MLEKGQPLAHYTILEKLGEGGMGAVYKALDGKLDRVVALKTLRPGKSAEHPERRFLQEAKSASALNHPNIITIYEIGTCGAEHYIAMEYIEGRTLRALIQERASLEVAIPVMRQLAEALAAAHKHGIVHRDIKPDNVMVRKDGYVKVLDFGVARLTRAIQEEDQTDTGITSPGTLLGTARYMSPEQYLGEPADGGSDVFSMGLVFFELVTGRHAFHASTRQGYMIAIVTKPAVHPSRLNPECPPALDALIHQMLSKDRQLRPSAEAVTATLAALGRGTASALAPAARQVNRNMVGRDQDLATLRDRFEAAAAGAGAMVCIAGEPGMGKTTLVEEFLGELGARLGVCWIGRGHCSERLGETDAYVAILECLDSLLRGQAGEHATRTMRLHAPTWYLLVAPAIGEATQETLIKEAKTASHERMRREFLAFFEELAKIRPVVLFFDDVHWSDASTCDLLAYLTSRIQSMRVLVISAYRPAQLIAAKHPFLAVKVTHEAHGKCHEMALQDLAPKDIGLYVTRHFPNHRFPKELIQVVHEKTEGNPLFMTDMLRYLSARRVIHLEDGRWELTQPIEEIRKEIPDSIRSMIQLKIDQFEEAGRRLLLAAAVQGEQFDSAVLARVLGLDPVEVEERLQALQTLHDFVRTLGEQEFPDHSFSVRYRFVHVFYQNALYGSLAPSRRAALSRSTAQAMVELYSREKLRPMAADVALLFEAARDFAQAATYFRMAARNAARVFAYQEAAILCERGIRALLTLPETPQREQEELMFSLTLGISLMATRGYAAPEVERTHARSRELCLKLGETRRIFPVLWGLHTCYILNANLARALELAREMRKAADLSKDQLAIVESRHAMATTLSALGHIVEARRELEELFATHPVSRHVLHGALYVMDPYVTSLCTLARLEFFLGFPDRALATARESVELANRLAHAPSCAYARFWVGWVHFSRGEYGAALAHFDPAIALSREHRLPQNMEWTRMMRGATQAQRGNLEEGIAEMRESLSNLKSMRSELDRAYCLTLLAEAMVDQGEDAAAMQVLEEALETAERTGERYYEPEMYRLRGELLHDEIDVRRALRLARERNCKSMELRAAVTLLQIRAMEGDPCEARAELAKLLGGFNEGRDTPEINVARTVLESPLN